jgi:hypothetical protein
LGYEGAGTAYGSSGPASSVRVLTRERCVRFNQRPATDRLDYHMFIESLPDDAAPGQVAAAHRLRSSARD